MATAPSQLQFVQEVPAATVGDTVPNPPAGSLVLFSDADIWYARNPAGVVTALSGVTNVTNVDGTITIAIAGTSRTVSRPAITGDIAVSAGSNASVLATVNANTGSWGDASHVPQFTVNAKGLTTAVASVSIVIPSTSVTGLGSLATVSNLTGDVTSVAAATTLATVNGNVGAFGTASNVAAFTVNGKGLTTAAANVPIVIAESQVTNLTTDLAAKVPTSRLINTTAPLTGGGDLTADRTFAISAATTTTAGTMSATDKKKLSSEFTDVIADLGADPTGNTDATGLINTWIGTLGTGGATLFLPPATRVRIDGPVNVSKTVRFLGGHRQTSVYSAGTAGNNMFTVTAAGTTFENLRCSAGAAGADNAALRTAGYAIDLGSASNAGMLGCDVLFQWSSVHSGGSLQFVDDANIREYGNNAINGACILIDGSGDRYVRRLTTDNGSNPTGFAGIRVVQCASLVISDSNIIHAGTCLALEPGNGLTVPSVEMINCFLDTSVYGMRITPTGTGSVFRCKFTNVWFGTHSSGGVQMNGTQWDGITFDNCDFYATGPTGIGIDCPSGGGKWLVSNSRFAGFTTAINLTASAAHFPTIKSCSIGPQSAFGLNTTGIAVAAGTYKGLVITDSEVVNNTTNLTLGAVVVGATEAGFYRITDNPGINPRGAVTTPTFPTSTTVVTNTTGFRVMVGIKGGTSTAVAVNGVAAVLAATPATVVLDPGGTVAITFTVAPTWVWVGN